MYVSNATKSARYICSACDAGCSPAREQDYGRKGGPSSRTECTVMWAVFALGSSMLRWGFMATSPNMDAYGGREGEQAV
jgi:hypothetical protein